MAAGPKGGPAKAMTDTIPAPENEASTLNHPQEQGSRIAPVRQCLALMWACKFCLGFSVTKHITQTVVDNIACGSKQEPLRPCCQHCGRRQRIKSENHNLVWAEVPWRRISQRQSLIELAEAMTIIAQADGSLPRKRVAYDEWNRIVGYKGRRHRPMPFRRWDRRVVGE